MSSTAGAAPPTSSLVVGLDTGRQWHHRAMQRSRALVKTYLLSSSVPPLPPTGRTRLARNPLRLPALATAKGPHRQTTLAPLSFSEPSFFTPGERAVFEGFSHNRRPSAIRKRPLPVCRSSPLPLCKACDLSGRSQTQQTHHPHHQNLKQLQVQSCSRPVYSHFSQPIHPSPKPAPVNPYSQNLTLTTKGLQGDPRPLVMQHRHSLSQGEGLSVVGKPCLPNCSKPSPQVPASVPARTQLHVFLPTEGAGEGEEADSESVDEGFMDELDNMIISLKLQQGAPKTFNTP